MEARKFWCHYIGNDGNTPKRRSIELKPIGELLPQVSNEGADTPIWYETEQDDRQENIYFLYAQLSDKVAVFIPRSGIHEHDVELIRMTDEDIDRRSQERLEKYFANYPAMDEGRKAKEREWYKNAAEEDKMRRDRYVNGIRNFQDYDNFLLSGCRWVSASDIRAYEEAGSPIYPVLQALREQKLAEREAEEQRKREERRKQEEEEARKKAEERAKEDAKLQKLVELGLLPTKLTPLQRGTVLAGLDERGRFKVAGEKMVVCTMYELIAEHGFNRISKSTETHSRWGEPLAKPRNSYCVFNDTLNYGYQINGHMGAIMVKATNN